MNTSSDFSQREIRRQAMAWLMRIKSCDYQEMEKLAFTKWLQHPAHQTAYSEAEKFWQQLDGLGSVADQQMQAARQYLYQRKKSRSRLLVFRLAFVIALVALLAITPQARYWISSDYYQTAIGEQRSIQLSDGSEIELNTDTELRVSYALGQRTVWLEHGEAWFNVVHDANHPFEVLAADKSIHDIGTQFNVYREGKRVTIAVQEGEVGVISQRPRQVLNITAGMQTSSNDNGKFAKIEPIDLDRITAWRSGLMIFKKQPLQDVAQELSRYHNVAISITDTRLKTLSVSGRFLTNNLNQTLNTIANALPVRIIQGDNQRIIIQRKN